ncbi:MAG: glycosyltransferase [Myxococcales bacterium]|nr:glycosyltransferase [Myxococcales bacterium]
MRILLATRVFWPNLGGIERHVQWLAEHLTARGHTVDVVTLDRAFEDGRALPPYDLLPHPHGGTSHVWRVPFAGSNRYPVAPRVAAFVGRYDLVHVHAIDFLADWLTFTRPWHGRPVVLSTHGGFFHTGFAPRLKQVWFQTMTRRLLAGVDGLIYTSDQDQALFARITGRGTLVRTGVGLDPWRGLVREPVPGRFVTVGRVDSHKGISNLLRALSAYKNDNPEFTADVVGPEVVAGLVGRLKQEAAALGLAGCVRFHGKVDEATLFDLVRTAELGLWPAEYESFGISVVETMAAGVVPVLNDIPAFRYFHERAGGAGNGALVDFRDAKSAARAIATAQRERGLSGEQRAREVAARYGWEYVVAEVERVYDSVLERASSIRPGARR